MLGLLYHLIHSHSEVGTWNCGLVVHGVNIKNLCTNHGLRELLLASKFEDSYGSQSAGITFYLKRGTLQTQIDVPFADLVTRPRSIVIRDHAGTASVVLNWKGSLNPQS